MSSVCECGKRVSCYDQKRQLPEPDQFIHAGFKRIFSNQLSFVKRLDSEFETLLSKEPTGKNDLKRIQLTTQLLAAISNELEEVRSWLPWKPWKANYGTHVDDVTRMELCYELVDVLHFLVELALVWDIDARRFSQVYEDKYRQNHKRQDDGY